MESDLEAHAETLDALAAWDGTPEQARSLRARVRGLNAIAAKAPDLRHRALRKAVSCYERQSPSNLLRFIDKQEADEIGRLLSPLLGDPAMGPWLHTAGYQRCGEREGREYLALIADTRCVVDEELQRFALAFFRVRRRATWMVAARAIAKMALRTPTLEQTVADLWVRVFPDGLPERWKPIGEVVPKSLGTDRTHLGRHVLYLGCAWLAAGGDASVTPGLDVSALAQRPFPKRAFQDSDKSLVLDALALFMHRDDVTTALASRVAEVGADPQADRVLESLAETPETPAELRRAVLGRLAKPRWRDAQGGRRREGAWSWVRAYHWMRTHAPIPAQQMLRDETELSVALGAVGGGEFSVEDTCEALRILLCDPVRDTSTDDVLLTAYVNAFAMLGADALAEMSWPSLLERAIGHRDVRPLLRGTVRNVGVVNLAVLLALRGVRVDSVLRDCAALELDGDGGVDIALSLAACDDGAVARHAAVQLERLLRRPIEDTEVTPAVGERRAQLNLLWRVLRVDPPATLFAQLTLMLRSPIALDEPDLYQSTELHTLVEAVAHGDAVRHAPDKLGAALDTLAALALDYGEFDATEDPGFAVIRDLAAATSHAFDEEQFIGVVRSVIGDRSRGLVRWRRWLGHEGDDEDLLERVERLDDALTAVRDCLPSLDEPTHTEFLRAADALVAATGGLASAERALFDALVDQMRTWANDQLAAGRRAVEVRRQLAHALDVADEDTCKALACDPERLSLLRSDDKRELNRFLQQHLLLAEARQVQDPAVNRSDVAFRSNGEFLRPLVLGAAAGVFFALDVGDPWLSLADAGDYTRLWATVVLGFAASFGLMSWDVGRKMQPPRWQAPPQRLLHPFGAATGAALLASVLVATSAGVIDFETTMGWAKLALWTSLSLFLGVFLHLIVGSGR